MTSITIQRPRVANLEELFEIRWWAALSLGWKLQSHWTEITIGQQKVSWENMGDDWLIDTVQLRKRRDWPTDRLIELECERPVRIPRYVTVTVTFRWI